MHIEAFKKRVRRDLLPEFCNDPRRRYDMAGFNDDFSGLSEIDAANFLKGLDAGVVKRDGHLYRASRSNAGEQFFWEGRKTFTPRRITLWLEPIITVATLWRLQDEFVWPPHLLGSQSVDNAFDIVAYGSTEPDSDYVACEIKKSVGELNHLIATMTKFAALPTDTVVTRTELNAYKKIMSLRRRKARLFWAVGPGALDYLFEVTFTATDAISFQLVSKDKLSFSQLLFLDR